MKFYKVIAIFTILMSCSDEKVKELEINKNNSGIPNHIKELIKTADTSKQNEQLRYKIIEALDSANLFREAIIEVDKLIASDSLNSTYWMKKGQLLNKLPDTPKAIKAFEYAAKIYAGTDQLFELANVYAETKNEATLIICDVIRRNNPAGTYNAQTYFFEAIYYSKTNEIKKSIALFDKCIKTDYTFMDAYIEKGFLYFEMKNYNEALKIFTQSTTINSLFADGYYWQAKCYEALAKKQEAIELYKQALILDKSIIEAKLAIERLK